MRIVITGASGNVGTALLRKLTLIGDNHEVHGIARRKPPPTEVYRYVKWHELDIADRSSVTRLQRLFRRADCVVHLAWAFQPTHNTRYLEAVGIGGSRAVLTAAHAAGVGHLLYLSSAGAYAPGRYGERVDEWWPTRGVRSCAHSRAKVAVEEMLDEYERNGDGVPIARIRPALTMQRDAAASLRRNVWPSFVDPRWLRLLPVLLVDRSLCIPVVHADDVAEACVRVIEKRATGPFNISAEPPVRHGDIARALGTVSVHFPSPFLRALLHALWRARLQPVDPGWVDVAYSMPLLNTERARQVLGWRPEWTSLDALTEAGQGVRHGHGTHSPVLRRQTLVDGVWRDLSNGPITTRRVP